MCCAKRAFLPAAVLTIGLALGGCSSFDPAEWTDFLTAKKPLPGERKAVFPEGVPGVSQGVPTELTKGYQESQAAQASAAPAEESAKAEAEKPKPKPKPKPKTTSKPSQPASRTAARSASGAQQQQARPAAPAWPDPKPVAQQPKPDTVWPDPVVPSGTGSR